MSLSAFQMHAWLQQCQAVIFPIPVALGNFGQEQEGSFVPDSAHGWHSSAQREGEATEKMLYPRSLKERTAQVFYFQDQQPFLVLLLLLFIILVLFFFPFSNAGACCFDPIHREYSGSQTPGLAKHP